MNENNRIHESGEDYLETILLLHNKTGFVRSVDIANELEYSKPSVSRAMGILKSNGLITIESSGQILLTEEGKAKANDIYNRHVTITSFLEKLGVSSANAELDACKIEHIISDETFETITKFLNK